MSQKSPTPYHSFWGSFASKAELPNVAGASIQDGAVEAGDRAYLQSGSIYVCNDPTLGAAVWNPAVGSTDRTGALNEDVNTIDSEVVVGGFVFDGSAIPLPLLFRFAGSITLASVGDAEIRLYDLGSPSSPAAGTLRSTISIANGEAGSILVKENTLSVVASPGTNVDEVASSPRLYEVRAIMIGASSGDSMKVSWSGLVVG